MVIYYNRKALFPTISSEYHSIAVGDFVEQVDARHKDSYEFYAEYEV